jgi:hypothetical protein
MQVASAVRLSPPRALLPVGGRHAANARSAALPPPPAAALSRRGALLAPLTARRCRRVALPVSFPCLSP